MAELAPLLADLRAEADALDGVVAELEETAWLDADAGRGLDHRPPDRASRLDRRAGAARRHRSATPSPARSTKRGSDSRAASSTRPRTPARTDAPERLLARWREGRTALADALAACRTGPGCPGSARR